ncbi:ORF6N domain-containing protein [Rhodospirillum sp. A1_3_36]|uniref:ORF6N domain-containing protein n=1 Tax=Rhodospirillum sp. A1_3_36 TaxID=3391666 RepID=UPI0039A4FAF3
MTIPTITTVQSKIVTLPGRPPLMLDADLAMFYGTETRVINQVVKRNLSRFPEDFALRLTEVEVGGLKSQNVISKDSNHLPRAFTQAGALALSGVLKTPRAAEVSVMVFRAFAERAPARSTPRQSPKDLTLLLTPEARGVLRYRRLGLVTSEIVKLTGRRPTYVKDTTARLRAIGLLGASHV